MSPTEKLVSLFGSHAYRTKSQLGCKNQRWPQGREEALLELQRQGRVLKTGGRYFLDASLEKEKARMVALALASRRLMTARTLAGAGKSPPPYFREAIEALVEERLLLRWDIAEAAHLGFVYLHRAYVEPPGLLRSPATAGKTIIEAYKEVSRKNQSRTVWISDLVQQTGMPLEVVHDWIHKKVIGEGLGTLDEADWPSANETQRAASIDHLGRRRLYIRLHL